MTRLHEQRWFLFGARCSRSRKIKRRSIPACRTLSSHLRSFFGEWEPVRQPQRNFEILYTCAMGSRQLNAIDRLIGGFDNALRTVVTPASRYTRANPAGSLEDGELSSSDRRHAAGLMRVNHAGEVAAQGLYQGHAAIARNPVTRDQMLQAADEEMDHLGWCEQRLAELGESPSRLSPIWYAGSFVIGAASGVVGDRWSLGFVEETEKQVSEHLSGHLQTLPENDVRSRAIVKKMREEEDEHGANAKAAGALPLPEGIRRLMRTTAKIMTRTAYRF